jgi:hypothetical protein
MPPLSAQFRTELRPSFDGVAYLVASCFGGILLWMLLAFENGLASAAWLLLPALPFSVLAAGMMVMIFIVPTWILLRQRVSCILYALGVAAWAIAVASYFGPGDNNGNWSSTRPVVSVLLFGLYFGLSAYIYARLSPKLTAPTSGAHSEA